MTKKEGQENMSSDIIGENKVGDCPVTIWTSCYESGWKDVIVPEAFSHPAKMSYGLLKRILAHAKEQGWIHEGDVIVDPFGGIGSTGILGAYEGYQVVCVELEEKFVKLAEQNFELHENALEKLGCSYPIILQGDSRRLCEVVEKADCIISSPPFGEAEDRSRSRIQEGRVKEAFKRAYDSIHQGSTPGQLGAMKPGKADFIVSSPPYAETLKGDGTQSETAAESRAKRRTPGGSLGQSQRTQGYGSKGNLGNLKSGDVDCVISSPPFMISDNRDGDKGNLPRQGKCVGPKYSDESPCNPTIGGDRHSKEARYLQKQRAENVKNLGNIVTTGNHGILINTDTFWEAALEIVEQCYQILKPGGHAIWVVKSFVRKGKIVDFPGDWQRLCESVGFKTVCIHHAMLVKETQHKTLFGHTEVKRKERKSFFRRLAESKGSPRIDFEVVLSMSRPLFKEK